MFHNKISTFSPSKSNDLLFSPPPLDDDVAARFILISEKVGFNEVVAETTRGSKGCHIKLSNKTGSLL